jgi:DNA (cytosine-5)-methyltransferase 1
MTVARTLPVSEALRIKVEHKIDGKKVSRTVTVIDTVTSHTRQIHPASLPAGDSFAAWWGSYLRGEKPTPDQNSHPLRFIDLFSSVGGLTLGAMEAIMSVGMRPISLLAADVDGRALQVYKANHRPRHIVNESVRGMVDFRVKDSGDVAQFSYPPSIIDPKLAAVAGSTDLILAGPPCQGHSSLNNHSRHDDPKNLLYLTVPAVAVATNARHVVIENVPNVVADKRCVVQTAIALLRGNGYQITSGVLAADRLGWSQTRKRFFIIASRDGQPFDLASLQPIFMRDAPLPVTAMLHDLESVSLDETNVMNSVPQLSQENQDRINWLFDKNLYNLPDDIRPDCHKKGTTYPATYGRMHADQPAPTITGGYLTPGRGRFIHPTQRRVLTPQEAARIQGFPDWFNFAVNPSEPPSRTEIARWIGNAVPSLLGYVATLSALAGELKTTERMLNDDPLHAA